MGSTGRVPAGRLPLQIPEEIVDESKDYLKRANQGLAKATKNHADIIEEQSHLTAVQESFKTLKDGVCENPKDTVGTRGSYSQWYP